MKMLVTGAAGQLGHDIIKEAEKRGHEAIGTDLGEKWNGLQIDITDAEAVKQAIREIRPDIVYHCAAWTAVDAAEDAGEIVFQVNAQGTRNIAEACTETDCKIVYISTDYVFNGQGTEPWQPDCRDYAPSMCTDSPSWQAKRRSPGPWTNTLSSGSPGSSASTAITSSRPC